MLLQVLLKGIGGKNEAVAVFTTMKSAVSVAQILA